MRVSWKVFGQKFGILSFSGNFHLLVFFRASLRSSRVISRGCCSFRVSYSLLSFSLHRAWAFSCQFYYQFYYYYYYYHHIIIIILLLSLLLSSSLSWILSLSLSLLLPLLSWSLWGEQTCAAKLLCLNEIISTDLIKGGRIRW